MFYKANTPFNDQNLSCIFMSRIYVIRKLYWLGPGCEGEDFDYWQFHAIYFPPLLRSATVKKHMVRFIKLKTFNLNCCFCRKISLLQIYAISVQQFFWLLGTQKYRDKP